MNRLEVYHRATTKRWERNNKRRGSPVASPQRWITMLFDRLLEGELQAPQEQDGMS